MSPLETIPRKANRTTVLQRVRAFIDDHYADGISLVDVARALNYAPAHLTSVVRRETGRPVTAWIIERRMAAARERLLATDETVAAVAEAVGFRDVGYFARRFARANGATPSRWRARYFVHHEAFPACPTCGTRRFLEAAC
jgi:AraC family transcriptional regulator, transcriptional activator of pobA